MALLMYEGFDYETTTPGADFVAGAAPTFGYNGWTGNATGKVAGLVGGSAISCPNNNHWAQWQIPTPTAGPYYFGFRYDCTGLAGVTSIIYFLDSASAIQCGVGVNATGKLIFWRGTVANIVGTGTATLLLNAWHGIEVQFSVGASVTVKVILNGNNASPEINVSGVNTQATGNANVGFLNVCGPSAAGGSGGGTSQFIDELYLLDGTGGAPYNTFLTAAGGGAPVRIETQFPTTNNSVAFTPNASTNASQVLEVNSDNDSTFNVASAAAVDTFNHGSLVSTATTIFAAMVTAKLRKDDVTVQQYRTKLISGGTTANGTTWNANTAYQYIQDMYINDPNTAAAWANAAAVNATKIGYERI